MFRQLFVSAALFAVVAGVWPQVGEAMPAFARQYEVSCAACHSAFPKLNGGGESFAGNNMKLPGWEDQAVDFGDDRLALPEIPPLAVRAQGFFQVREGRVAEYETDDLGNPKGQPTGFSGADNDLQSPYLIKLLSSAPLSENLTYYFYGIMAEKGGNGSFLVEDAWFGYQDAFGTGVDATLGQFQVSDLMFARETRLNFQDYMVYRMADITYDRGLILSRGLGPVDLAVGAVNGNGIEANETVNAPGYARADHSFDNDHEKSAFTRLGFEVGGVGVGLMGLSGGWQGIGTNEGGDLTTAAGSGPDSDIQIGGLDLSGRFTSTVDWYAQYLQVTWTDFLDGEDVTWDGGFAGVDWIPNDRWAFSALYNHTDSGDLDGSETVYDGIDMQTVSLTASYYFMRNVKGLVEVNADLLDTEDPDVHPYGHLSGEDYLLMGFDAAF